MKKLIKKILTDKKVRNSAALTALTVLLTPAGQPWLS